MSREDSEKSGGGDFRKLGKKRNFKDSQLFEGEIRGKERLKK